MKNSILIEATNVKIIYARNFFIDTVHSCQACN